MTWLERNGRIRRRTHGGERDPNKALLLLYALGRLQREGHAALAFREIEEPLAVLLAEFGPPKPVSPGNPFHHLVADRLWEVDTATGLAPPGPDPRALRAHDAASRLDPGFAKELLGDPVLFDQAVQLLLDVNFEPSLHEDLRIATGLLPEQARTHYPAEFAARAPRDIALWRKVLVAYDYGCAFCGYEGWIGGAVVGLEAARLRWWAFDGHDDLTNVLCLCTLHHRLLDKGVIGLTSGGVILVSKHFTGVTPVAQNLVLSLAGRGAARPLSGFPPPSPRNTGWHTRQVFRGPART
jgi:putative restriction endonuclease